ncbi:BBP7 family outer membrane beta-barrel protein [Gemmata sp. JC673]|uniref:BBP7 family outer membrane beta-barrel protein n=1 Tax=Gemmata algarum TaxID=2975278 RepID=A0ABU5FAE8_9BACT|nr:BBP7 family outer membrane beta-barrel protein [Gemmata algarum]MDY3563717.1 BBP7 family outer membrane beta-barrel protein [Gemmata algarum]
MRRILLGGLGVALGVFAPPALAQQPRTGAPRAASLGRPSALPDSQPTEVTQTGLLRGGAPRGTVSYAPGTFGSPAPATPVVGGSVTGAPPVGFPVTGVPATGGPIGYPVTSGPVGYPVTGGPAGYPVTSGPVPGGMVGFPVTGAQPAPLGSPRVAPGGGPPSVTESRDPTGRVPDGTTFVPSVLPDGGAGCPVEVEDPLYTDAPLTGLDRVASVRRGWVSAELLMWWNRGTVVPPLVTTSSPAALGIIGQGDTRVLLGGSFGDTYHTGGRVGAGYWFGDGECRGVDARLFWVAPATTSFFTTTAQNPLLARPFFNINPTTAPTVGLGQSSEIVARPGVANGSVLVTLKNTVWGAEVNYRRYLTSGPNMRLDLLAGYRFLDLREELTITERFVRTPDSDPAIGVPAISGTITDSFRTTNRFHGGQIGIAGTFTRGRWSLDPRATVAFGTVRQTAEINGSQTLNFPDQTTTVTPGGLLAVPGANIGKFSRDKFAVVPEVGLNLGWQATERMKLFVGYNFLYLSSALRPGDAIDMRLDAARVPNLLPPGTGAPLTNTVRPVPQFNTSGYFVQGISFGLMYRW